MIATGGSSASWGDVYRAQTERIAQLERELAEARSRRTCGGDQPYICHDLATARSELAEALAALKAHGIHLESANCWCKPEVVNYADDE